MSIDDEARALTSELRDLLHHLMAVREAENSRVARELHDEIGSSLTAVNMDLMTAWRQLGEGSPQAAQLARAATTLRSTVEGMRRIIEDLRPTMLESLGLREAIRSWAQDHAERSGAPLTIDIPEEIPSMPAGCAIGLFRIAQEALTNAVRHAKAGSIGLTMRVVANSVVLEVVDDGVGILPNASGKAGLAHGLLGIRERAIAMGGASAIGSGPGGRGTEVRVTVSL